MFIIYIAANVTAKYERPAVTMSNKSAVSSNATETTGQKYKKFNARSSCREYGIETETSPKVEHVIAKPAVVNQEWEVEVLQSTQLSKVKRCL